MYAYHLSGVHVNYLSVAYAYHLSAMHDNHLPAMLVNLLSSMHAKHLSGMHAKYGIICKLLRQKLSIALQKWFMFVYPKNTLLDQHIYPTKCI